MAYILFVLYLVLFAWLVTKIKFFANAGLSKSQIIIIFLLKIIAGIFYGWIGIYYGGLATMWDTWRFHVESLQELKLLQTNPIDYLTNLFVDPYNGGFFKFFETSDSYWSDLKGNALIKLFSVFDIFSFGHYYINVIFYSFLTYFGSMAVFRVMNDVYPGKKKLLLVSTFLIPSFLYWTSGLHKEGLIFTGIAFVIYSIYFGQKENKFGVRRIFILITGLLLILILRNFLIVIIVPAIFAWLVANKFPKKRLTVYISFYSIYIVLFFSAHLINPNLDFPRAVVTKQQEFIKLRGVSSIPIKELEPNVISFIKTTPQAISLSTFRPYPADVHHILSLAASMEVLLLCLIFLLFLFFRQKNTDSKNIIYFCVFFSLSILLAIGFSVNNLGAIVRYRSIIIPFLVIPMVLEINWNKIVRLANN